MQATNDSCSVEGHDNRLLSVAKAHWLLIAAILGFVLVVPEVITRPLFGDDAYYLWGATQISHSYYPIRDFYAIDPAGTWAYFCGIRFLFGDGSVGYWIMLTANVAITGYLLGKLARHNANSLFAGIWTAFLFVMFQLRCTPAYALVGKDMLGFPFVLGGLLLATRSRWWLPAQLLVGVGLAIKPTLGALWLVWMACDFWQRRDEPVRWVLRAALATVAIGIPFLAVTYWAEQHGWGWAAFKAKVGLAGGNYGSYWSGETLYKLIHAFVPILWMLPLAALGMRRLRPFNLSRHQVLLSVLLGGLVNWGIQPMLNSYYFVPYFGGIAVLAGIGVVELLPRMSAQIAVMTCAGLFFAFVPATNLRWLKFVTDIKGKEKYTLAEHQSRVMEQYALGNTPPYIQEWVRNEVFKLIGQEGRVGVLVTDGDLLWALRDYRPGFWADWSPSWNPHRLAEGVASGSADVIVGIEDISSVTNSNTYYDQVAKLRWNVPEQAMKALHEDYQPMAKRFGYVIYLKQK
jgi:hypothetical protein